MSIKLINTKEDYQHVLEQFSVLFDAKIGTSESDEADLLAFLVDEYEKNNYPIHWYTASKHLKVIFKLLASEDTRF